MSPRLPDLFLRTSFATIIFEGSHPASIRVPNLLAALVKFSRRYCIRHFKFDISFSVISSVPSALVMSSLASLLPSSAIVLIIDGVRRLLSFSELYVD